jgi:plasmid stability protein
MCQMCEEYEAELRRMGIAMNEIKVNLDDRQLEALEKRAASHGHDVEAEVRAIVDQSLRVPMTREEFTRRAKAIAAMTPPDRVQTDSAILLREDRDR